MLIESVTAHGQTVIPTYVFNEAPHKFSFMEWTDVHAFWADDCFVISYIENGGSGNTYIIYDGGFSVSSPDVSGTSTRRLFEENGELLYVRTPNKYLYLGGQSYLKRLTSRDEFYRELGTVEIVNGETVYTVTKNNTFEDAFDLDAEWTKWQITLGDDYTNVTLDEYLAENAKTFERTE